MIKLDFAKYNPSGNTTVIIDNRNGVLQRSQYASSAVRLMSHEKLCAEQVGYLEPAESAHALMRLHMMGGEFCGNATRCAAKMLCDLDLPGIAWDDKHENCRVNVEVSGAPTVLTVNITDYQDESAKVLAAMPVPHTIAPLSLSGLDKPVLRVQFDGICHLVLQDINFSKKLAESLLAQLLEIDPALEAAGFMFYQEASNHMIPVVYVSKVGSLIYESSCGSGSVAVAAARRHTTGEHITNLLLKQPGGELEISYADDGENASAVLGGVITIICKGLVWI